MMWLLRRPRMRTRRALASARAMSAISADGRLSMVRTRLSTSLRRCASSRPDECRSRSSRYTGEPQARASRTSLRAASKPSKPRRRKNRVPAVFNAPLQLELQGLTTTVTVLEIYAPAAVTSAGRTPARAWSDSRRR